jgi:hypothetical protein
MGATHLIKVPPFSLLRSERRRGMAAGQSGSHARRQSDANQN